MTAIVKKIILEIRGKELSLTVEDAKALRTALDEVLGKTHYVPSPYPYVPYTPWVTYRGDSVTSGKITCGSDTVSLSDG